jgi:hypothetical protein
VGPPVDIRARPRAAGGGNGSKVGLAGAALGAARFCRRPGHPAAEIRMREDKINLELLGARVATLTDRVNDVELRMRGLEIELREVRTRPGGLETRFGTFEQRFDVQEERMIRMLAVLVRLAERQGGGPTP